MPGFSLPVSSTSSIWCVILVFQPFLYPKWRCIVSKHTHLKYTWELCSREYWDLAFLELELSLRLLVYRYFLVVPLSSCCFFVVVVIVTCVTTAVVVFLVTMLLIVPFVAATAFVVVKFIVVFVVVLVLLVRAVPLLYFNLNVWSRRFKC